MTSLQLTAPTVFAMRIVAWLYGGALIGAVYFATLRWNVRLLAFGRAPFFAVAIQTGRFVFLICLLAAIAGSSGALPLTAAAAGIVAARTMMTMRLGVPR